MPPPAVSQLDFSNTSLFAAFFIFTIVTTSAAFLLIFANESPGAVGRSPKLWLLLLGLSIYFSVFYLGPGHSVRNSVNIDEVRELTSSTLYICALCCSAKRLRSRHCYNCKVCVDRFDHHCFFLGCCIGRRNHFLFILLLAVFSHLSCWMFLNLLPLFVWSSSPRDLLVMFLIYASFCSSLGVTGLCLFHCYLASTNRTTWEVTARKIWYWPVVGDRTFDRGLLRNWTDLILRRHNSL